MNSCKFPNEFLAPSHIIKQEIILRNNQTRFKINRNIRERILMIRSKRGRHLLTRTLNKSCILCSYRIHRKHIHNNINIKALIISRASICQTGAS